MIGRGVALLLLILAGCAETSDVPVVDLAAVMPSGLFTADDGGLQAVNELPGLMRQPGEGAGETVYSWDVLQTIEDNRLQLLLLQVSEPSRIRMTLQSHVVYDDVAPPTSERRTPPATCFHSWATNVTSGGGPFLVDRAMGLPGEPPAEAFNDTHAGPGLGHGSGASGAFVNLGNSYDSNEAHSGKLPGGGWMLFEAGVSQAPVASLRAEGNRWWLNWTIDGPHRVVAIPSAPMYCYFGFGETTDADVFIESGIPYTQGSHLEATTQYGTTVIVEQSPGTSVYDAAEADNEAFVDVFGTRCRAGHERPVAVTTFAAGDVGVEVVRWFGNPRFILTGMGPLPPWSYLALDAGAPSCPAP